MPSTGDTKIEDSYLEYKDFVNILKKEYPLDINTLDLIIPRWSLGALYTASNTCDYKTFKKLYKLMEGRQLLKRTLRLKDRNTSILAFISFVSPRLLYTASRSIKL